MDVDNLVEYAAASSLLSNWDGLAKNSWIIRLNSSGWRMPNCVGSSPTCAAKTWRLMPASLARTFGVMGAVDTLTDHQMIDLPLHYPVDGIGLDASMHQGQGDASPAHPLLLPLLQLSSQYEEYLITMKCSLQTTFGQGLAGLESKLAVYEEVLMHDLDLLTDWACHADDYTREGALYPDTCDGTRMHWYNATQGGSVSVEPPVARVEQLASSFTYMRNYFSARYAHLAALPSLADATCAYSSKYWSDDIYWRRRGLPGIPLAGDTVLIPGGEALVIDMDTPVLGKLVIQGFVQVSRSDGPITLNANYIFVMNGGRLQAGTRTSPFESLFTIQLHGTRADPLVQRWGSKVLAVLKGGQLSLHGQSRSPSWSRLTRDASSGTQALKLPTGAGMDWGVDDEILITTSSHHMGETEVARLASVTHTGDIVLSSALSYNHYGSKLYSFSGDPTANDYDGRSIAASLSRNIKIHGSADPIDGWGCSLVVQGLAYVERVELRYCGKRAAGGAFAALIDGRGPGELGGYIHDSLFRDSYGDVLGTRGDVGSNFQFELTGNVVFMAVGVGYSLQAPVAALSNNVAASIHDYSTSNSDADSDGDRPSRGGIGFDMHVMAADSNVAVGCSSYGFQTSAWECGGIPALPVNTAMACTISGVHVISDDAGRARCGRLTGFVSLMNKGAGFSSLVFGSLTITNVASIDNSIGFKLEALYAPGMSPTTLIIDGSIIVARVGSDGGDGPCVSGRPMSPAASIGVVPATFLQRRLCTEETPSYQPGGCDPSATSTPVLMAAPDSGFMEVRDTTFINYRAASDVCGPSYAFTQMDTAQQTVVFTKMKAITALDGTQQIPVPWFLPTTAESADGGNHVVIEDRDGSFSGEPEAWLVSRNVGMALDCALMGDQKALRCP